MFERLLEFLPPAIIKAVVAKKRKLNEEEMAAQSVLLDRIRVERSLTRKPVVVAIIGLVGSGKSSVASALAERIGATVVESDAIRIELRKHKASYNRAWAIAENMAEFVLARGGNVVLDSDSADPKKRASLRERFHALGARLIFVRTVCDYGVMSQRIRENDPGPFFSAASSKSTAKDEDIGKDVKFLEAWRRTPQHYRWINQGGGKWVLKKFPFAIFATIDTTNSDSWRKEVARCANLLLGQ